MNRTKIPWVINPDGSRGWTWNPITGCSPASEGCQNCYAAAISKRFGFHWGSPVFHPSRLREPCRVKKPSLIFVCSMSDLFHEKVTREIHEELFATMAGLPRHTFILLTKRPERMALAFGGRPVPSNVWIGVTAENQARWDERVPILMSIPARVHFVSIEPMLGPVYPGGLPPPEWVIAGPENGAGARPCRPEWIDHVREVCAASHTPFFDKRELSGAVRQMPGGAA